MHKEERTNDDNTESAREHRRGGDWGRCVVARIEIDERHFLAGHLRHSQRYHPSRGTPMPPYECLSLKIYRAFQYAITTP